jgi:3-oxoacyl-[acyl-carrier-protein] synthase-1
VSARKLLDQGLCDAVLVGGVDALCRLTVCGFSALESTSAEVSQPMSRNRRGINIGEGAALFLMSGTASAVELLGAGESSDAHHISAPHPEGLGAEAAMRAALKDAGLAADAVDYLNLHATATPKNDEMESRAVARVFTAGVAASGTKPMTGHTLGAAGAIELAFCWLALRDGRLPPHVWDGEADPALPRLDLVARERRFARPAARVCMSNSFAFGGSNACLLAGDAR